MSWLWHDQGRSLLSMPHIIHVPRTFLYRENMKNLFSRIALITLLTCFIYLSSFAGSNEPSPVELSKGPVIYKPSKDSYLQEFETSQTMISCIEDCKKRNQMASVGVEAIMDACQHTCNIEKARTMSRSRDPVVKEKGTRLLCKFAEKSTVPDLITLLQEDLVERTGIWAEIIPALGRTQDDRAVPVLIDLVSLSDDDWLGRGMAVTALGEIGAHSATKTVINAAWRAETRDAAIDALAKMRDPRAAPTLVSAIQPEEDEYIRERATSGLIQLKSEAVAAIHDEFINYSPENKQTRKRVWLCEILALINDKPSQGILQKSYNDPDPAVEQCVRKYH